MGHLCKTMMLIWTIVGPSQVDKLSSYNKSFQVRFCSTESASTSLATVATCKFFYVWVVNDWARVQCCCILWLPFVADFKFSRPNSSLSLDFNLQLFLSESTENSYDCPNGRCPCITVYSEFVQNLGRYVMLWWITSTAYACEEDTYESAKRARLPSLHVS